MKKLNVDSNLYYVYILRESSTMEPIYIGKGKRNRALWHLYASKFGYHYNKKLERKIRKLTNNFINIESIIIDIDSQYNDENMALNRECELIRDIGINNLCNLTEGGDNPHLSSDSIKKIVSSRKSNGKPWHSNETKEKIGKASLGRKRSEASKQKFSENHPKPMLGKKHTDKTKLLMSKNHVDFTGNKNPFYGKTHTKEVKNFLRMAFSCNWIIYHDDKQISVVGKTGVKDYIENYNKENNTRISYKTLLMYKKINKHNIQLIKDISSK